MLSKEGNVTAAGSLFLGQAFSGEKTVGASQVQLLSRGGGIVVGGGDIQGSRR